MPASADPAKDTVVTPAIIVSALGAALGGLLFGALQTHFALSDQALGFTVASALIGTVIGSLGAGAPADRFGRRPVLLAIAALLNPSASHPLKAIDFSSISRR